MSATSAIGDKMMRKRANNRRLLCSAMALTFCACGTTGAFKRTTPDAKAEASAAKITLQKKLENGFYHYTLAAADGATLNVYGAHDALGKEDAKPLLVVVSGSGCSSVFRKKKDGTLKTGLPGVFNGVVKEKLTVVALDKRGVSLGDNSRGSGRKCTKTYHRFAGLDTRKADYLRVIVSLKPLHPKVIVVGHSEGTDVGAAIVAESKDVDALGFMSGGGPTQAFDFFLMLRKQMHGKDPAQVEAGITQLQGMLADVFKDPTSDTKMLFGHPYSRWASYFKRPPIESLVKIDVPIFVAHGSADTSVPIESADYIAAEFLRLGKKNLTYRRYPSLDHSFYSCSRKDKDCDRKQANRFPEVITDFMRWVVGPESRPASTK